MIDERRQKLGIVSRSRIIHAIRDNTLDFNIAHDRITEEGSASIHGSHHQREISTEDGFGALVIKEFKGQGEDISCGAGGDETHPD